MLRADPHDVLIYIHKRWQECSCYALHCQCVSGGVQRVAWELLMIARVCQRNPVPGSSGLNDPQEKDIHGMICKVQRPVHDPTLARHVHRAPQ